MGGMPWWFWIVLWSALVVCSLGVLAWLLYRVFLKAKRALDEALEWEMNINSELGQATVVGSVAKTTSPAIFTPVRVAYSDYVQGKNTRTLDRAQRRTQRRNELGQPQLIGDLKRLQER